MRNQTSVAIICSLAAMISASHVLAQHPQLMPMDGPKITKAIAVLSPTQGNQAHGVITFTQEEIGVRVVADLAGLLPGKHGFHIHEFGDCSSADGSSAGGHFNPMSEPHGAPDDSLRHMGDMGNIVADTSGAVHAEWVDHTMMLNGPMSIVGHAVILHANPDDLKSQPAGNAGPRIACGVIGVAKE